MRGRSRADRVFRLLLRLFPSEFRGDFGDEMSADFGDERADARTAGRLAIVRLWWRTIAGSLKTAPREHLAVLVRDAAYGLRLMRKYPLPTAAAILTIALGVGANTAMFTVVNAVLLQLPFEDPARLVSVLRQDAQGRSAAIPLTQLRTWNERVDAVESLAGYTMSSPVWTGAGAPDRLRLECFSANMFSMLGASPAIGRTFAAREDSPGAPPVVVVSHSFWSDRLGGDPASIGRVLTLDGVPVTVIGVMSKEFDGPRALRRLDGWIPLTSCLESIRSQGRTAGTINVYGRLKRDISPRVAEEQMDGAVDQATSRRDGIRVRLVPLTEQIYGDVKKPLLALLGAAGFVLLIACANVASLLLARSAGRQKEVAIRGAIGARRGVIIRQLLVESLLLAGMGAVLGLIAGVAGARALLALSPGDLPRASELAQAPLTGALLDWRLVGFTLLLSVGTGLLFGLAPALHLARTDLGVTLKEGGARGSSGTRAARTRGALVVAEIALALVLLVGATLLIRTFVGLRQVQPGFDPQNVLTLQTSLAGTKYSTTREVDRLTQEVTRRINAIPGVMASASAISLPTEGGPDLPFAIEGRAFEKDAIYHGDEQFRTISPDYFKALSIPLVRGRFFTIRDVTGSTPALIINAALAKKFWPDGDALGQRLTIGRGLGPEFEDATREIVGIVGDVREQGLGQPAPPILYIPSGQASDGLTRLGNSLIPISWLIRASALPPSLTAQIQKEFLAVDPLLAIAHVRTMEQVMAESIAQQNFNMLLLTIFGIIALALAAIGIYGLMSYSVEQSTHDIGVRVALGADRRDILSLVVWRGMRLAAIGLVLGVAAAAGAVRVLATMLFGVNPLDPATFAIVVLALGLTALLACYLPARRAMRVDPIVALRHE
jgi:predicted permease